MSFTVNRTATDVHIDECSCCYFDNLYKDIFSTWNISKDNTILFLNEKDGRMYNRAMQLDWFYWFNAKEESIDCQFINKTSISENMTAKEKQLLQKFYTLPKYISKNISIILPELHAKENTCPYHIENINKVCKKLKEEYGVERIELFVIYCFIEEWFEFLRWQLNQDEDGGLNQDNYNNMKNIYIDKITTTNLTNTLEVQKSDRLEVVDCVKYEPVPDSIRIFGQWISRIEAYIDEMDKKL